MVNITQELDQDKALALAREVMRQEGETLQALAAGLGDGFWECAQVLIRCPGLIWVTGVGTSAAVGERFAHILTGCGARSMFLSPADGLHGHTGVMAPADVLIAMSRGGESSEVNQMVEIANGRGVTTMAFVHNTGSSLAQSCGYVLPIRSLQEHELMGYLATTSTVAFCALCDALCAVVLEAKGYTAEQFAATHPGGAVGQVLGSTGAAGEVAR
ncbi:MAG TPA: SIS domain-containing protein [Anaerolineae bacterium]|nr:SIS domain-containing protein [Anaerolineae bacterium]